MVNTAPACMYRTLAGAVAEMGSCNVSQLGLRFDRVVVRVLDQIKPFVDVCAPEGASVILTLTAPVPAPKQMVSVLQQEVVKLIQAGGGGPDRSVTLHGSQAKLRLVEHRAMAVPKLLGFVHNPSVDAAQIIELADEWLRTSTKQFNPVWTSTFCADSKVGSGRTITVRVD